MLATLERPTGRPVSRPLPRTEPRRAVPPAAPCLTLVAPAPIRAVPAEPARCPVRPQVPVRPAASQPRPLRMTMRARRLIVGLGLLCSTAGGIVAVDVLAAVVPAASSTSYAAQGAPYVAQGSSSSGGLVPSSGATITVGLGDTLWSLAERVDPDADPRDVIAAIMALNELDSPILQPGQVLRLP